MFSRNLYRNFLWRHSRLTTPTRLAARRLALLGSLPAGYLILNNSDLLTTSPTTNEPSLKDLVRSYIVYSLCSIPPLVDHAPGLLDTLGRVPVLKALTYGLVKVTFFDQFVGGETAGETVPLLRALRAANKGALFAYSVEVDEKAALSSTGNSTSPGAASHGDPLHKRCVNEIISCIDVAADFEDSMRGAKVLTPYRNWQLSYLDQGDLASQEEAGRPTGRRTWVAIKVTALLPDAQALIRLSKCITDQREWMKVHGNGSSVSLNTGVERVPFPGSPFATDLDVVLSGSWSSGGSDNGNGGGVDRRFGLVHESLSRDDIRDLRRLYDDLVRICHRAQERGVRVIVDAEYSWYQPALDALTLALMREFNAVPHPAVSQQLGETKRLQPLVYATYQAYLRRTREHLAYSLRDAERNGYALGVKLVRGAYHPHELGAHAAARGGGADPAAKSVSISPDTLPPVWLEKGETDNTFNDCVKTLIGAVKDDVNLERESRKVGTKSRGMGVGVLFGTHNWDSCHLVLNELVRNGLAEVVGLSEDVGVVLQESEGLAGSAGKDDGRFGAKVRLEADVVERVAIGQLYGMCDDLTESLVRRTVSDAPLVIKYIPYGNLTEVLPYLSRRAIENKSVLGAGGAARERKRAFRGIVNRLTGLFSA
ncbi:FAD-linked oxidoreductase [Coprinopsis marcescibilis]|uniref:Proline dehydrogenase n=1 Tax=Coprinopsis marcescibilis TaxID=230819 RepID=A0A5C3L6Q9_COPMA|nr:FAD-linked oxidoreductase [Coprinopsis marcescibilis]